MPNIRKSLLQFIFLGAYMKRWNDKLRPTELFEIDKQGHKMLVAWLLCQENSKHYTLDERIALEHTVVEHALFDYFYRLVITDIKPPVFYRIKENSEHYARLSEWVIQEIEPILSPLDAQFWQRFCAWARQKPQQYAEKSLADKILEAAHIFASAWEFHIINQLDSYDEELPKIAASFEERLKSFSDIEGMEKIREVHASDALGRFAALCGNLRFQKRWSQTPRIPETSVLGHMFVVACYGYFFSLAIGACKARCTNNFFIGLFHDLPELLTRDIISPVKKSSDNLDTLIKQYENEVLEQRIFMPLNNDGYHNITERLSYFLGIDLGSEFAEAVLLENADGTRYIKGVCYEELQANYNTDFFDPRDGKLIKYGDSLAAFIEAYAAVHNGINSEALQAAIWRLREQHKHATLPPLHIGALFADFD